MLRLIFPELERGLGFVLIVTGLLLSMTLIGTFIGVPLIFVGAGMLGKSAFKIEIKRIFKNNK